jgi:hypothetical protein
LGLLEREELLEDALEMGGDDFGESKSCLAPFIGCALTGLRVGHVFIRGGVEERTGGREVGGRGHAVVLCEVFLYRFLSFVFHFRIVGIVALDVERLF